MKVFSPRCGYGVVVLRVRLACALFCATALVTSHARAQKTCELRWEGDTVPLAWSSSLREVRELVETLSVESTDCRTISVSPDGDAATVVFTTVDGRSAIRRVAEPRELRGLVEALLVTGRDPAPMPPPPPPVEVDGPPAREEPPLVAQRESAEGERAPRPAATSTSLLVGAGAGVKGSFPRDTLAAVGQVFAGAALERWELAAFGRWELEHNAPVDSHPRRLEYSAIGGGAMFARREPLGPLVIVAGGRASVLAAEQERERNHDVPAQPKVHDHFLDPRLGIYAGCIFSETSRVRLRVQVDADAGLLAHRTEVAELPLFPRWNMGISIGAETGLFR